MSPTVEVATAKGTIDGIALTGTVIQQVTARTIFQTAISLGVNKGLRLLGVSATIAGLASAFVSGGLLGAMGAGTAIGGLMQGGLAGFVTGGITELVRSTIPIIGEAFHIAPEVTGLLSSLSFGLMNLGGNLSDTVLKGFGAKMITEFAVTGVEALGNRLGLDWRITQLINLPVRSFMGDIANRFFLGPDVVIGYNPDGTPIWATDTRNILDYAKDALFNPETLGGFVSVGAELIGDALDINPLLISLGLRGLLGGVEGLFDFGGTGNAGSRFVFGLTGALKDSLVNILTLGGAHLSPEQRAYYISNLISFAQKRGDLDIFDFFQLYANQILGRDSAESILQTGQNISDYFKAKRQANDYAVATDENGNVVHEYEVGDAAYILNEGETVLMERRFGDHVESGEFVFDQNGNFMLKNGAAVYQTVQGTIEYTVRSGRVMEITVTKTNGQSVTVYGDENFPLEVPPKSNGEFEVKTGIARNWEQNGAVYYKDGYVLAPMKNNLISYSDPALAGPVAGSVSYLEAYTSDGVSMGAAIFADDYTSYSLREGNYEVAQALWSTSLDNMSEPTPLEPNEVPLWQTIQNFQLDTAEQLDNAVDDVFNYVRPALDVIQDVMPLLNADVIDFVGRTVAHGLVDVIRFSTDFDDIINESGELIGNWETSTNDERLKRALSIGGKSLNELFRAIDLVGFGSMFVAGIRGAGRTAAVEALLSNSGVKEIAGETLEQAVKRLLKSTLPDDVAQLQKLFRNPAIREEFLKVTKSIDGVAEALKRGYLGVDEVADLRISKSATEINAELRASHLKKNPSDTFYDAYKVGTNPVERITVESEQYVRFYDPANGGSAEGRWLAKRSEVQGLTPSQIKDKFGLKFEPTHVVDVNVSPRIKIRQGIVEKVPEFGVNGGGEQIQLLEDLTSDSYTNARVIGEEFN